MRKILLLLLFLFIFDFYYGTSSCVADGLYYANVQITPNKIHKMINQQGLHQTVNALYNNYDVWRMILKNIASGESEWLEIALLLQLGTDAGSSEMLDLAMGEALENSPKQVLRIIKKGDIFTVTDVCSGPDVDDSRYSIYDKAITTINRRIAKIEKVDDADLKDIRNLCITNLKESIPHLKRYFGVK